MAPMGLVSIDAQQVSLAASFQLSNPLHRHQRAHLFALLRPVRVSRQMSGLGGRLVARTIFQRGSDSSLFKCRVEAPSWSRKRLHQGQRRKSSVPMTKTPSAR
jgi:hypothetical protein